MEAFTNAATFFSPHFFSSQTHHFAMKTTHRFCLILAAIVCASTAFPILSLAQSATQSATQSTAQDTLPSDPPNQFSIVFGLTQPLLLGGFNAEVVYWTKHFVFDYSHGFGLKPIGVSEDSDQRLQFRMPHTLGIGVGYRFTEGLNLRVEPKLHFWELYYDNATPEAGNRIANYTTFTLGLGAYYRWLPFEADENLPRFLRGITIIPSARWWPNVSSTLDGNSLRYNNTLTQREETHRAKNIGVANTPFFVNVSIGYTF
jgi:hypothetical protein